MGKMYEFSTELIGIGETREAAWENALEQVKENPPAYPELSDSEILQEVG